MIEENTAEIEIKIAEVEADQYVPNNIKEQQISELKKSLIVEHGGDSSFKVITSIANTMIGSSIIVYPVMFIKDGIVGALLVLLAIGAALFFTCRLLLIHNRPDEMDFGQSIKRILGNRWAKLNSAVNIILIYIVSIAYFMLICGNFFDITSAIIHQVADDYTPPESGQITLKKYSQQYATFIAIIFTAPLIWRRDIQFLMKFFKITIYFVFFYGIFVLAAFIRVVADGSLGDNFGDYQLFNPDFSTVAGAFALSLLLHPVGAPILKRNRNQNNNMRDLFLGYCLTALIYVYVGFMGALTCSGSIDDINNHPSKYQTIFDCFPKNENSSTTDVVFFLFGKIVQLGIFLQNLSVMPILSFLTRKEFLEHFQTEKGKRWGFVGYNISLILLCFIITFFEVDVSIVLSLNGAIIGFFMAYGIPIATHLACYHKKLTQAQRKQRSDLLLSTQSETESEIVDEALRCNSHPPRSKLRHYTIYGALLVMGFAVACFKLYAMGE